MQCVVEYKVQSFWLIWNMFPRLATPEIDKRDSVSIFLVYKIDGKLWRSSL